MDVGRLDETTAVAVLEVQRRNAATAQVIARIADDHARSITPVLRAVIEQNKAILAGLPR